MRTGAARGRTSAYLRFSLLISVCLAAVLAETSVVSARTQRMLDGPLGSTPTTAKAYGQAQKTPSGPLGMTGTWKLILNAPFTGSALNTSLWQPGWFGTGVTGPINGNELACYSPANVSLGDGTLDLRVTASSSMCEGVQRPYTGALLSTNPDDRRIPGGFQYTYGAVQARVYIPPAGVNLADWPAVITLGQHWPEDGEDDILENLEGTACSHFHSPLNVFEGLGTCDEYLTPGWHTVASDWEPGSVTWYYDGAEIGKVTEGVTSAPMYLVIVNTVSVKGQAVTKPDTMRVAYVRVWQHPQPAGS